MKQYPCIEQTLDIKHKDRIIRLWLDEDKIPENSQRLLEIARAIEIFLPAEPNNKELIEYIHRSFNKVNAVQIKDGNENLSTGIMVYFVEF